jgi:micrococcal nuclease
MTKRLILLLLISITILLTSAVKSDEPISTDSAADIFTAINIKDGDSFDVLNLNNQRLKIRLFGIDCPEYKQDFSAQAKRYTNDLIYKKQIRLELIAEDRYQRSLANAYLSDGRHLNHELVKLGLCRWYQNYAPNDSVLRDLEAQAKSKRLGVWSLQNQIAPWDFRATERERRLNLYKR